MIKFLEEARELAKLNKISKAAQPARRAYELAEQFLPVGHPDRNDAAEVLGNLLVNLHQQAEGERLLREAGKLQASGDVESAIAARNHEMVVQMQRDQSPEMFKRAEEIVESARRELGATSLQLSVALANLGILREHRKDYAGAEKLFVEVLSIRRAKDPDPELVAVALKDLARIHQQTQRYPKALALYREALALQEKLPDHDLSLAGLLAHLARACTSNRLHEEALGYLERAVPLFRETVGNDDPALGAALHLLAGSYSTFRRTAEAEKANREAWSILEKFFGRAHPETLQCIVFSGLILQNLGREQGDLGLEHLRTALTLAEEIYFQGDPALKQFEQALAAGQALHRQLYPQ